MTQEIFARYLEFVRGFVDDREQVIHLLAEIYSPPIQPPARELADALKIQRHFIPAGLTDERQPLDRRVFGALKSAGRRMFTRRAVLELGRRVEKGEAERMLIHCRANRSAHVFASAWKMYKAELEVWHLSENEVE
jgi:hypothetical protein